MHRPRPVLTRPVLALAVAAAVCSLAACGQAEDAAKSTASSAASKAASKATDAAKDQAKQAVTSQVCKLVEGDGPLADGTVTKADRAIAAPVAATAETAGIDQKYVEPLKTVADPDSTAFATKAALSDLKKACA